MTIKKTHDSWHGTEAADLDVYLAAFCKQGSYEADLFEHCHCACGHDRFRLEVDDDDGCARRTCAACGEKHLMLDSAEYWADAEPQECACPCGEDEFELAVAFARTTAGAIRWVTIGARCVKCELLGAYADWKIDYEPADHLYSAI